MKESNFTDKFIPYMEAKFPFMWKFKVHGHEMQNSAVPDFLFCVNSIFLAIEFKVQRNNRVSITPMQIRELNKIINAQGIGLIIAYDENINKILVRTKRLDYNNIFLSPKNKIPVKSKSVNIDWDFEFNNYEDCIDIIGLLVDNKGVI